MLGMHSFLQPAILALTCIWIFWEMNSMSLTLKDTEPVSRFAQTWSAANFLLTFPSKIHAMKKGEIYVSKCSKIAEIIIPQTWWGGNVCVLHKKSTNWSFALIHWQKVWVSPKDVLEWISSGNSTWARKDLWVLAKIM